MAGLLALVAAFPVVVAFKIRGREDALRRRGVDTEATVVGTESRSGNDYLVVEYEACRCRLAVRTTSPSRHPVGSRLPIRYDPLKPVRADALVDRPNPYEDLIVLAVGVVATVLLLVPLVLVGRRRQRALKGLVATTVPTARVRVESWRRPYLFSTVPYVSVYPTGVPQGGPPLLAFPATEEAAADLDQDEEGGDFELFGSPEPGARVALRRGELVVTSVGRAKSAEWAAAHRGVLAPAVFAPGAVALVSEPAEARKLIRLQREFVLLFALAIPAGLIRIAPERFLPAGLVVLCALAGAFVVTQWRYRRLMNRFAARLPGPAPTTRRDRRAARDEAARRIRSTAGRAELAALLGTTPEGLKAQGRRAGRWLIASVALSVAVMVAALIRLILA